MKFGLRYCNTARYVDAQEAVALAQAAETAGFESLWTVEHTIVPAGYASAYPYDPSGKMAGGRNDMPLPDPLIWMAFCFESVLKSPRINAGPSCSAARFTTNSICRC